MAQKNSESAPIPWSALLTLISALGGIVYFLPPLTSSRPDAPPASSKSIGYMGVDARLWQDPIEAADRSCPEGAPQGANCELGTAELLKQQIRESRRDLLVLAVMVTGGPYPEDHEARLRRRYAVASALAQARTRYVPEDEQHVGAIRICVPRVIEDPSPRGASDCPRPASARVPPPAKLIIPYEWWRRQDREYDTRDPVPQESVLVLWLREEMFVDRPLRRLATVRELVRNDCRPNDRFTIIGPQRSATLRSMFIEAQTDPVGTHDILAGVRLVSPSATAADDVLGFGLKGGSDCSNLSWSGLTLARTIATDDDMGRVLWAELQNRGVSTTDEIALISEWDTLYGRALPLAFAAAASNKTVAAMVKDDRQWPDRILRYSYLRGIDGKIPGEAAAKGGDKKGSPGTDDGRGTEPKAGSQVLEPPEGQGQSDYVRRMVDQLVYRDACIRDRDPNGRGLRAVGILGSDVYDKLLILRALRKELPTTLFFTTDLDARFQHATEYQWTHNLIVASPYGLSLGSDLQRDVLPFRDSYQTSVFRAALLALGDADLECAGPPCLFEIGRTRAVRLGLPPGLARSSASTRPSPRAATGATDVCSGVDGEELPADPHLVFDSVRRWDAITFVAVAAVLGWAQIGFAPLMCKRDHPLTLLLVVFGLSFLMARMIVVRAQGFDGTGGEPLLYFEGVSIWPTELVRLMVLILAIAMLVGAAVDLRRNRDEIEDEFDLGPGGSPAVRWFRPICMWWRPAPVDAAHLWDDYRALGSKPWRAFRIALMTVTYVSFGWALTRAFGGPVAPCRGAYAMKADLVCLWLSVLAMIIVTFYVGDAARVATQMIENLCRGRTGWPATAASKFATARGMSPRDVRELMDVVFIGKRTKVVAPLIYYPFVLLLLMILARGRYFDNWDWPPALVAILALNMGYAALTHLRLRRAAERARADGIRILNDEWLAATGRGQTGLASQLKALIEEIENIRAGAFAKVSQHPLVVAVLLPLSGVAATVIIQYFSRYY